MKKCLLAFTIFLAGFATSLAQESDNDLRDNKMKEYDEIIIKRKDTAKDGKVVIEIRNQEVIVDGKPIDQYDGDDFIIIKERPRHYSLQSPSSPFRFKGDRWSNDNNDENGYNDKGDQAFLGLLTEGSTEGAKVVQVSDSSAAAKAGLKKGDVILKVNDKEIADHKSLSEAIASQKPNDKITITYKRDGKESKTTAVLGKRPTSLSRFAIPRREMPYITPGMPPSMDFNFDENGLQGFPTRKARIGIKAQDTENGKGVKVIDVEKNSPADKAGIKKEDIITSFEGKEVNAAEALSDLSQQFSRKSTLKLQLKRNGRPQNVEIKIPKKLKTANI